DYSRESLQDHVDLAALRTSESGQALSSKALGQRLAYFPVVAEWIDDSAQSPAVLVADGMYDSGARSDGALEGGIGIVNDHHHPNSAAAKRLRAEIQMLWRFVSDPELGTFHGQPGDDFSTFAIDTEDFQGSESRLVEVDGLRAPANR